MARLFRLGYLGTLGGYTRKGIFWSMVIYWDCEKLKLYVHDFLFFLVSKGKWNNAAFIVLTNNKDDEVKDVFYGHYHKT